MYMYTVKVTKTIDNAKATCTTKQDNVTQLVRAICIKDRYRTGPCDNSPSAQLTIHIST